MIYIAQMQWNFSNGCTQYSGTLHTLNCPCRQRLESKAGVVGFRCKGHQWYRHQWTCLRRLTYNNLAVLPAILRSNQAAVHEYMEGNMHKSMLNTSVYASKSIFYCGRMYRRFETMTFGHNLRKPCSHPSSLVNRRHQHLQCWIQLS